MLLYLEGFFFGYGLPFQTLILALELIGCKRQLNHAFYPQILKQLRDINLCRC